MSLDNYDNHDANFLPFADYEIATDVQESELRVFRKLKHNKSIKTKTKSQKNEQSNDINNEKNIKSHSPYYVYFENTTEDENILTVIPYTGPCNTLHLGKCLYLPQLISKPANDSTISFQRFIQDYDRIIMSLTSSLDNASLSIFLRFGISYVRITDPTLFQSIPLRDFSILRNRDKQMKTAFYTCKGVTSPKRLLTTLTTHNYHEISSNTYSYDIQLYGMKNSKYSVLHFLYDEQLQCCSILYRPDYPINFDFIRNKTSSIFRSIDDSYADIFDFRIQLTKAIHLSKTDSEVLKILRDVPINQVLFVDKSTQFLYVSKNLQRFVKYLKCTRSSNYKNFDEQIVISIGTYEEFQLNKQGQCELTMTASNTMTIELVDLETLPSGKKLYDIGLWFSTLCQTCVDLSTTTATTTIKDNSNQLCKWFSDISAFRKKSNQPIKQMNVNQLTTYKTQKSNQIYTSKELAFVKKILQEENLKNILFSINEEKFYDKKDIQQRYENIKQRLKTSAIPSANEALKKVERTYRLVCEEFDDS